MEQHFHFENEGCRLLGVLHTPEGGTARAIGLVLLHGWAGYRIGAHQMFVKLAREASRRGFACLRFDFRGRGDSEGEAAAASLATMIADAVVAAHWLVEQGGVEQVAFVGDCSGSEVGVGAGALVDACRALVLWSAPIVGASREAADKAKRRDILRQYLTKLFRRETWAKLLAGRLQPDMIKRALLRGGRGAGEEGSASDRDIDWLGRFIGFRGEVLFIYGAADPTTEESVAHYEALTARSGRPWRCHLVEGANHAFYSAAWEQEVIDATLNGLAECCRALGDRDG